MSSITTDERSEEGVDSNVLFALPKPRYADPCNRCGICCHLEICPAGDLAFPGASAPCPGILKDGDGFLCGLVVAEDRTGETILREMLGIGCGCSMPDEDTTEEEMEDFDNRSRIQVCGANDQRVAPATEAEARNQKDQ